ncbi:MAG: hypothetical protein AAGD22_04840 [Verrucomicrobiota bacterium]
MILVFPANIVFAAVSWSLLHHGLILARMGMIAWLCLVFPSYITTTESIRCLFLAFSITYWLSVGFLWAAVSESHVFCHFAPSFAAILYCVILKATSSGPGFGNNSPTNAKQPDPLDTKT